MKRVLLIFFILAIPALSMCNDSSSNQRFENLSEQEKALLRQNMLSNLAKIDEELRALKDEHARLYWWASCWTCETTKKLDLSKLEIKEKQD